LFGRELADGRARTGASHRLPGISFQRTQKAQLVAVDIPQASRHPLVEQNLSQRALDARSYGALHDALPIRFGAKQIWAQGPQGGVTDPIASGKAFYFLGAEKTKALAFGFQSQVNFALDGLLQGRSQPAPVHAQMNS